jgi:hypothetical protein
MSYYDESYTDEILTELYEKSGTHYFTDRDYLVINVKNKGKSWGQRLLSFLNKKTGTGNIQTIYSGYIREDGSVGYY